MKKIIVMLFVAMFLAAFVFVTIASAHHTDLTIAYVCNSTYTVDADFTGGGASGTPRQAVVKKNGIQVGLPFSFSGKVNVQNFYTDSGPLPGGIGTFYEVILYRMDSGGNFTIQDDYDSKVVAEGQAVCTPTKTITMTKTATATRTPTFTRTPTKTQTPTVTKTVTITPSPTGTIVVVITTTQTPTGTVTETQAFTATATKTDTATVTMTLTSVSDTTTPTPSVTATLVIDKSDTPTSTVTLTESTEETNTPTTTAVWKGTSTPTEGTTGTVTTTLTPSLETETPQPPRGPHCDDAIVPYVNAAWAGFGYINLNFEDKYPNLIAKWKASGQLLQDPLGFWGCYDPKNPVGPAGTASSEQVEFDLWQAIADWFWSIWPWK